MNVVFRADASVRIGIGHVVRCLTLARELQRRGARPRFICREQRGDLIEVLRGQSVPVSVLPPPPAPASMRDEDYAGWLGVPADEDAASTIEALHGDTVDWVVVDHYGLDAAWEGRLRSHTECVLVIDDLANRRHDCDVLLDQNYVSDRDRRYAGLVPATCQLLTGPRYALLAPEYVTHRQAQRSRDNLVRRLFVYFGGADPANMTGQALTAVSAPEFADLTVDVVIGPNHPHREELEAQAARRSGTSVHGMRPHLGDLMAAADLAIGAAGVTTWERMCLGLPSVVVSIAENQRATCEALAADDLIEYVGDARSVDASAIRRSLSVLLANQDRRAALSAGGQRLIDGKGTERVVDALFGRTGISPSD